MKLYFIIIISEDDISESIPVRLIFKLELYVLKFFLKKLTFQKEIVSCRARNCLRMWNLGRAVRFQI